MPRVSNILYYRDGSMTPHNRSTSMANVLSRMLQHPWLSRKGASLTQICQLRVVALGKQMPMLASSPLDPRTNAVFHGDQSQCFSGFGQYTYFQHYISHTTLPFRRKLGKPLLDITL
jgi:hypothetical protein